MSCEQENVDKQHKNEPKSMVYVDSTDKLGAPQIYNMMYEL